MSEQEIQKRNCRCCNRKFDYPVLRSKATRFHCPDCAPLKPELRKIFELMNRRLKQHQADLEKLKAKLS